MEVFIRIWEQYPIAIDLALYFFVFTAAARVAFAKSFPGHGGKALSVAVGLFLAAGLAMAQRKLGFSTESLGPIAVFILCGIVFLASYKFIQQSDVSKPVAVLLSALIAFALARAAMPGAVGRFVRRNPLTVSLVVGGLLLWAWHSSGAYAAMMTRRTPGNILARNNVLPNQDLLKKEGRFVKKRMRDVTRRDEKDEEAIHSNLSKALRVLEREELTPSNRQRVNSLVEDSLKRAAEVENKTKRLLQLDNALRRFDLHWFRKARGVNFGQLTPSQQKTLQDSLLEERKRLQVEEELEKLETETARQIQALKDSIARAKDALAAGNAAGATGWLAEAVKAEAQLHGVEEHALDWEKRLLKFVRRQNEELTRTH